MEENELQNSEAEAARESVPDLGKFKSVDALLRAYGELEAEFTRRSQKLKELRDAATEGQGAVRDADELYRMVNENEGVRARILSDYLASLKGVPLLTNSGTGVTASANEPKTFAEAGSRALGYLKKSNQ